MATGSDLIAIAADLVRLACEMDQECVPSDADRVRQIGLRVRAIADAALPAPAKVLGELVRWTGEVEFADKDTLDLLLDEPCEFSVTTNLPKWKDARSGQRVELIVRDSNG